MKYYQTFIQKEIYKTPEGYTRQECNLDILLKHCRIKDGKILLDNGVSYAMLVLPEGEFIDTATLKRIAELVKQGAVIAGPKPLGLSGNLNHIAEEKEMKDLSEKMWGKAGTEGVFENSYGKGKVYCGISIKDILNSPDCNKSNKLEKMTGFEKNKKMFSGRMNLSSSTKEGIFLIIVGILFLLLLDMLIRIGKSI